METLKNQFSNQEITVTYEPCVCIHADRCAKELSDVFRISIIPWIDLEAAETLAVIEQIKKCPSGALKYRLNKQKKAS
ncbi:(4Fe-4S)-binding protein [Gaetbulibacter saemankumensis]|uniref:(4Fe-4S)-binding protein n=1 Tax=Gaetbulibacter saemankumensis TaxID=311208 RepID=UPI000414E1C6|nr:(4Fe-4S)-binding protein [Gaetbulibacter saemankumensis]